MGCDICYTNHADADQNDMDVLLTLFGAAGINFIMGIRVQTMSCSTIKPLPFMMLSI